MCHSVTQAAQKSFSGRPVKRTSGPPEFTPHLIRVKHPRTTVGSITEKFLLICKIFGELSDLQDKAKKEGILKNDTEEGAKMTNDENFAVRNSVASFVE